MNDYNSVQGIEHYLSLGLDGLHELMTERREAGYTRRERLEEFIVNGCFWFDTCGNVMACTYEHSTDRKIDVSWLAKSLPSVITRKQLGLTIPTLMVSGSLGGFRVPSSSDKCEGCNKGWTLQNVADARIVSLGETHKDCKLMHVACLRLKREAEIFKEYSSLVEQAGFVNPVLTTIPNEYWREEEAAPWVLLKTHLGNFKIGSRKRVIVLDWSNIAERLQQCTPNYEQRIKVRETFSAEKIFKDEDVTKDDYYIHAWGCEKLVSYLQTLRQLMFE